MAKKEKVLDLKPEKINEEELNEMQVVVSSINQSYMELGRLVSAQHNKLHNLAAIQDKLLLLQEKMRKEYGTDDINVADGTINYPKENGEVNKKD